MVSGLVTSPWDQLRIFSGEARLIRMESKSVIVLPRSNGLERYKVFLLRLYATAHGSRLLLISLWSQPASGSAPELRLAELRKEAGLVRPCLDLLVRRCGNLFLAAFNRLDQLHIQAERLQFANQHVERLRHAGFNGGLALHNGLINLGAAKYIV